MVKRVRFSVKALAVIMAVLMLLGSMLVVFNASATEGDAATPEGIPGGGEGQWVETDGTITVNGIGALSTAYRNQKTGYAIYLPKDFDKYANNPDGEKLAVMLVMSGGSQFLNGEYYYMSLVTSLNYLADKEGIILLYVRSDNETINQNFAWAWWQPSDYTRDETSGYVPQRVTELVEDVKVKYKDSVDEDRTYVVGLSAGGSMAATFAALYPDVFAGAVIVGGTPYKVVTAEPVYYKYINMVPTLAMSYQHAYNAMHYGTGDYTETPYEFEDRPIVLGGYIKEAWSAAGVAPENATRVAIFHGTEDTVVRVENGRNIAKATAYARYNNARINVVEQRIGYTATFYGIDDEMVANGYSKDRSSDIALYEFEGIGHAWISNRSQGEWSDTSENYDFNLMLWEFLEGGIHEEFEIKSVTHEIINDKIVFSVTTNTGDAKRIKAAFGDDPSGSIRVADEYTVDAEGNRVWTIKTTAPTQSTTYAFDARGSSNKYYKNYFYYDVNIESTCAIKSVSSKIDSGKIYFTIVTAAGEYNRIKVTTADKLTGSLGVANTYTIDAEGNYVWTIKAEAPTDTTSYAFDLRTSDYKYTKDYFMYDVTVEKTIKAISCQKSGTKLVFTVVTKAGDFTRLRCGTSEAMADNLAVANSYTVNANGEYVWTIKVTAPTQATNFYFDLRDGVTGKYMKEFTVYNYTLGSTIKSVSCKNDSTKLVFTVVTKAGDFTRLRCGTSEAMADNLAVANSYTVDANGDYVWTIKVTAPTQATNFYFDLRDGVTGKYIKEFFSYSYTA